ncbi:Uncharacterised protein [uncultured archaeon]|nr:Uncharacterised protein [uncultured archaeon]
MGRKDAELKDFLIAQRKKIGSGASNAPVWVMQKAGKRIYNKRAKKHWRETNFGAKFDKLEKERNKGKRKSGDKAKRGKTVKHAKSLVVKRPR